MINFFTIKSSAAGFGDQINQFHATYLICRRLGLEHIYTPPSYGHLSQDEIDILPKYLGLNLQEIQIHDEFCKNLKVVKLDLAEYLIKFETYDAIKSDLSSQYGESNLFILDFASMCMYGENSINNLFHNKFKKTHSTLNPESQFSYPSSYKFKLSKPFRDSLNIPPVFTKNSNAEKIVVHIRRGDTSIMNFGDYFFDRYSNDPYNSIEEALLGRTAKGRDDRDYYPTEKHLKAFDEYIESKNLIKYELCILSDGYNKCKPYIPEHLNREEVVEFNNKEFDVFNKYNPKKIIGEGLEKLLMTFNALIEADVIICGKTNAGFPLGSSFFREKQPNRIHFE